MPRRAIRGWAEPDAINTTREAVKVDVHAVDCDDREKRVFGNTYDRSGGAVLALTNEAG